MCGIIGIIGQKPVTADLFQGMLQLQHRGQDASGMFVHSPERHTRSLRKRLGLVQELFQAKDDLWTEGEWGLGHVRYTTAGKGSFEDAQPLVHPRLALVHNGNLVNYLSIKRQLEESGAVFTTDCDSETLLHLLSTSLTSDSFDAICSAVEKIYATVEGSYSVIALLENTGLFAFRDPHGIRPLIIGQGPVSTAFASEPPALWVLGYRTISDLQPGEVAFVDAKGSLHRRRLCHKRRAFCSFEFNYFAKAHSLLEGKEIYQTRAKLGEQLARRIKAAGLSFDAIVPIPESGNAAAIALARALSLPFEAGFVKMNHVGRTFLFSTQEKREQAVSQKLFPIASVFRGKSILLVDDSIVRGTVSKKTIALAREVGAARVSIASTFPPVRHPCVYGIDFPHEEALIASGKTIEAIRVAIGADAVIYNSVDDLKEAIGFSQLCTGCMTGKYPTPMQGIQEMQKRRKEDLQLIGT